MLFMSVIRFKVINKTHYHKNDKNKAQNIQRWPHLLLQIKKYMYPFIYLRKNLPRFTVSNVSIGSISNDCMLIRLVSMSL